MPRPLASRDAAAPLALVALFLAAGAVLTSFALRVHSFQPDELLYVQQGRALAGDFPFGFFDTGTFGFGIERLNPLVGAITTLLFDTPSALTAHKVVFAFAFASVVFPAYLLGRAAGLSPWLAVLAAALSVAVPYATLSTSFLTEPVAYPAFGWGVYGIWYAATRLGLRGDLVGLVLVGIAAMGRTNFAALGGALLVTVAVMELRGAGDPDGRGRSWVGMARRHVLLLAVAGAAVLVLAVKGTDTVGGQYPVELAPSLGTLLGVAADRLEMLAQGLVIVPLAFGAAWMLRHAFRPVDHRRQALAVAMLSAAIMLLYSLTVGIDEERYLIYLVPLVMVGTIAAVAARDTPPWLVAATGAGSIALALSWPLRTDDGGYGAFLWAGQTWWGRVVLGRAGDYLPGEAGHHAEVLTAIGVMVVALALLLVARRRERAGAAARAVLLGGLLACGVAAAAWALPTYIRGAGFEDSAGFAARNWIDPVLPEGQRSVVLSEPDELASAVLSDNAFYNERAAMQAISYQDLLAITDRRTGRMDMAKLSVRNIVGMPEMFQSVGLPGAVADATYLPFRMRLFRLPEDAQAQWVVEGPNPQDGWIQRPNRRATISTYGGSCAGFDVVAAPDREIRAVLRQGSHVQRLTVPANAPAHLVTAAPGRSVLSTRDAGTLAPDKHVSLRVANITSVPCGGAG